MAEAAATFLLIAGSLRYMDFFFFVQPSLQKNQGMHETHINLSTLERLQMQSKLESYVMLMLA